MAPSTSIATPWGCPSGPFPLSPKSLTGTRAPFPGSTRMSTPHPFVPPAMSTTRICPSASTAIPRGAVTGFSPRTSSLTTVRVPLSGSTRYILGLPVGSRTRICPSASIAIALPDAVLSPRLKSLSRVRVPASGSSRKSRAGVGGDPPAPATITRICPSASTATPWGGPPTKPCPLSPKSLSTSGMKVPISGSNRIRKSAPRLFGQRSGPRSGFSRRVRSRSNGSSPPVRGNALNSVSTSRIPVWAGPGRVDRGPPLR